MSAAARGSGSPFSNLSQSISCSGDRGIRINRRGGLGSVELSGALVSDIIATLHFADDPMQQAGSDHLVSAKLRPNVLKKGIALGRRYRFGSLHQPIEIVIWESQSQLV